MTEPAPVEFADLAEVVRVQLGAYPVATPESAEAMRAILDEYEGAIITGHGHDHVHRLVGFHVVARTGALDISIKTDPCPVVPPV